MVNFPTGYVPHLSNRIAELRELIKKSIVFDFCSHYRTIFHQVKVAIADHHTLALYDPLEKLVTEVDVSQTGLGACLLQGDRSISFASKSHTRNEVNHNNIE